MRASGHVSRTSACTRASGAEVASPSSRSIAWHAHRISIARTSRASSTARSALSAAAMLMLTWSSLLPDVGIVSTLAGCASVLSSEVSAAAVTCAIISPDCSPPWRVRNAGRPLLAGLTSRSDAPFADRGELGQADGQQIRRERHRGAVEVAARDDFAGVGEDHRVVGGGVGLR